MWPWYLELLVLLLSAAKSICYSFDFAYCCICWTHVWIWFLSSHCFWHRWSKFLSSFFPFLSLLKNLSDNNWLSDYNGWIHSLLVWLHSLFRLNFLVCLLCETRSIGNARCPSHTWCWGESAARWAYGYHAATSAAAGAFSSHNMQTFYTFIYTFIISCHCIFSS